MTQVELIYSILNLIYNPNLFPPNYITLIQVSQLNNNLIWEIDLISEN